MHHHFRHILLPNVIHTLQAGNVRLAVTAQTHQLQCPGALGPPHRILAVGQFVTHVRIAYQHGQIAALKGDLECLQRSATSLEQFENTGTTWDSCL